MSWFWVVLGLAALAVLGYLGLQIFHAARQVREAIKRLARRDFRPVISMHPMGMFRKTAQDLRVISEHLEAQNRKIADEGFSLRAILASMVEGVMIVDPSLRIRLVNEALKRMFGMRENVINRTVMEVFMNPDLQRSLQQTFADGKGRVLAMDFRGSNRLFTDFESFEVYTSPLVPGEKTTPGGAVVVFHNITQLKKLETARRDFVANVSHEFRTPLSIISGYLETLQDGGYEDQEMLLHSLAVMRKHGRRLNLLIDDLLTISKLEHQEAKLDLREIDLRAVVRRVLEESEEDLEKCGVEPEVGFGDGEIIVEGEAWRIEQAFSNLVANSLRYAKIEGRELRISISAEMLEDRARVRFSDNGPGIPAQDLPRIFERFYRVHKDRSRDAGGTGLGLAIVKNIVTAHGGNVRAENAPDGGAVFLLEFPLHQHPRAQEETASTTLHQLPPGE